MSPQTMTARALTTAVLALLLLLVLALPAAAHVTVRTDNDAADGFAVYTMRIPNERDDSGTSTVRLQIPEELAASRYEPLPGWEISIEDGILTLDGGTIEPGQFIDVRFQARNPAEPTTLRFAAVQTYESGEEVSWTGAEGSDTPASFVEIVAAEGGDDHGSHGSADGAPSEDMTGAMADDTGDEGASDEQAADVVAADGGDGAGMATAALAVGVLGIGLGGTALLRSRRS